MDDSRQIKKGNFKKIPQNIESIVMIVIKHLEMNQIFVSDNP